nr:MAG TPA: hypothetical protein [Caudoviricetes sp.]
MRLSSILPPATLPLYRLSTEWRIPNDERRCS